MKRWLLALALVVIPTVAWAYQSTVNPLVPVQNSPLQSVVVRNNFAAANSDINFIYSLLPGVIGSVITSGSVTAGDCAVFVSQNVIQDVGPCPGGGSSGVSSLTGTSGQIAVNQSTGAVTISLPSTLTQNTTYSGTANFTSTFKISGTTETFPASGNIVGTSDTQTLTGKSIAGSEINSGTISTAVLPTGTNSTLGIVQCDNSTITCNAGIISATTGGGGNVTGPLSSTTNAIATYSNTAGTTLLNNSGVTIASNVVTDTQAVAAALADGIVLITSTAATTGAQKFSPSLRLSGNGFKSNSVAASQQTDWDITNEPVQGTTAATTNLVFSSQVAGGGFTTALTLPSGGGLNLGSGTYQIGGTQIACANLSNGATGCSTVVGTSATVNTGTSGATIPLNNGGFTQSGAVNFTSTFSIGGTAETFPASGLIVGTTDTQTLTGKTITMAGALTTSAQNIVTDTTTGTKIGTGTTQKLGFFNATPVVQQTGDIITALQTLGLGASLTIGTSDLPANQTIRAISFTIDGGGSTITTGVKGFLSVPFACTINSVTMLGDQSGSIVVDIWKKAFASSLPTIANTITASDIPTISSATTVQDSTLTGWTTSVSANDMIGYNVNSVTTMQRVTVTLKCTAT